MAADSQGADVSGREATPPTAHPLNALIDTNVLLDLLLKRDPWYTEALPMWEARDRGQLYAHIPASVLTDIFYICRKQVGVDGARRAVEACLSGFTLIVIDHALLQRAFELPGSDFEDNVQVACAQVANLDCIVTRDPAGFHNSPIMVAAPSDVPTLLR